MSADRGITFFHSPRTRSSGTLLLLEELGAPFELKVLDMKAGEQRQPGYLKVNPMGKVPAILHGDALVTEQVAIHLYLADLFPQAGLAPALDDPLRGPYLRWMVFYAACFEPALVDRALQREPGRPSMSPYGDFDTMLGTLVAQLAQGPWLLGERFTAADVLWGTSLTWTTGFKLLPERPEISAYIDRFNARPCRRQGQGQGRRTRARPRGSDARLLTRAPTGGPMAGIEAALRELDGIAIETQAQKVKRRSRDFYWYSPVLKRRLDAVTADAVVTPSSEAELVRTLRAAYAHKVPVTARGGGTGNYGQAMPLRGGLVVDLSSMTAVKRIGHGVVRVEAGRRLCDVDAATIAHSRQELRLHPSTHKTGTIGGYVAGGSSGVGSITWGLLRDRGNILGARVVTMEARPRILELRGADLQKVNHAYGTNGIITELEMPLAPAYRWVEQLLAFPDFMAAVQFADALAREDAILKKLVTPIAAPVPHQYLFQDQVAAEESVVLVMVADFALDALAELRRLWPARKVFEGYIDEVPPTRQPLFEYAWNHTTLQALKHDRGITYLQTLFPPPHHLEQVEHMHVHFGDEVPMHLEFVRYGGEIACFGLQLVRFKSEERLMQIIAYHEEHGCPIFNPHAFTLEEGGMKRVDRVQLAFKRETDPSGLLNPGKMRGWDEPDYDGTSGRGFLYDQA